MQLQKFPHYATFLREGGTLSTTEKESGAWPGDVSGSPSRWTSETEPVRGDFQNNKGLHVARSAQIH